MELRNQLILFVGLGVVAWLLRGWAINNESWLKEKLLPIWRLLEWQDQTYNSNARYCRWFVVLCTLFVPAICSITNWYSRSFGYAYMLRESISYVPVLALLIYVAWRSACPGRWLRVIKAGILVLMGQGFALVVRVWLIAGTTVGLESLFELLLYFLNFFLVILVFLIIAGRVLRLQLVGIGEQAAELPNITIKFFLVMQAALAGVIVVSLWMRAWNPMLIDGIREQPYVMLVLFAGLLATFSVVPAFYPLRYGDLPIAIGLFLVALAGQGLVDYFVAREFAISQDLDSAPSPASFLSEFFTWQKFSRNLISLAAPAVITRFLFRMAGLRIVWGGRASVQCNRSMRT